MSTQAQRTGSKLGWRSHVARLAALIALLGIALLLSRHMVGSYGPLSANLLFQSPPTDTPDPNSSLPTPTHTNTPFPLSTATATETPTPSSTPSPTSTPLPVGSSPVPTSTPPAPDFPADTPEPTWTTPPEPAPPAFDPQPLFQSPLQPPTPILSVAPPAAAPTVTIQASPTLTTSTEIVLLVRPLGDLPASAAADTARPLDAALFIDNLVIAAGYVWTCFGVLALLAGVIGGVLFLRRGQRPRQSPPAAAQPTTTAQPSSAPLPPSPATLPASQHAAAPPPAPRVAARHRTADSDDLDRPDA